MVSVGAHIFSIPPLHSDRCEQYYLQKLMTEGLDFNEYTYVAKVSYRNELDLNHMSVAMHFDSARLGTYFRGVGNQRNIVCVDGNFSHVKVDEDGFIKTLCLDGGVDLDCDFVFDCSGFAKLLIGKYYKVPWVSQVDYLPMKKALAFHVESEKEIKPYTQAISMKYGWLWKIAIQDRIGAGYVFDSDYVTDDEALDEVQQFLGQTIPNARSIPFEAGRYEKVWVKNCIAVGLSSNFIEPLEATSLDSVVNQLRILRDFVNHFFTYNENSVALYNGLVSAGVDGISHFIYLHYLTKRNDTEFWKTFQERHPPPQKFEGLLDFIYENNIREYNVQASAISFGVVDFIDVMNGLELVKKPMDMYGYENLIPSVETYKKWMDEAVLDSTSVVSTTNFLAGLDSPDYAQSPFRYTDFCLCAKPVATPDSLDFSNQ